MISFANGDKVEVKTFGIWFPATVNRSAPAGQTGKLYVIYDTLFDEAVEGSSSSNLRTFADLADVRPAMPPEHRQSYRLGEEVEVLAGGVARGWRRGSVKGILGNSKFLVEVAGGELGGDETREVDTSSLRVPPSVNEELPQQPPSMSSGIDLVRKHSHQLVQGKYVEVMRPDGGGQGEVWYPATVIQQLPHDKFLVGYLTVRTDEGLRYIQEEITLLQIRPSPPIVFLAMPVGFKQVDCWHNGGWWDGYVSRAVGGNKYVVCLRKTGEEMVFDHYKLRPHQYLDSEGGWNLAPKVTPNQGERSKALKLKINGPVEALKVGMMVEIRTDEDGFIGSWFPAMIVTYTGNGEYLIRYHTLRTEDGARELEEVVDGTRLRPCPPKIERDEYKVLEEVDAWHNDGWWAGLVSRFIGATGYAVYFWTTNEEYQYSHEQLRPHQDWTRGKWTAPTVSKGTQA